MHSSVSSVLVMILSPARARLIGVGGALLLAVTLSACQPSGGHGVTPPAPTVVEQTVRYLPLAGPIRRSAAELSGLTWYEDWLVLLPQYPDHEGGEDTSYVYALERAAIERALADSTAPPLRPRRVPLVAPGLQARTHTYEGCEAIAFVGDRVYVLVESKAGGAMRSYLLAGHVAPGLSRITLDVARITAVPMQTSIPNMAYEALVARHDTLVALYEANGAHVNAQPVAQRFTLALGAAAPLPSPTLEYRITDATTADSSGRFWVVNYFYPGERDRLKPAPDSLTVRYGTGPSHAQSQVVERLVELRIGHRGVRRTRTPPIPFVLEPDVSRNWEGVARLGTRGFLVVTDRYPETLLAFVPAASNAATRLVRPSAGE